MASGRLLVCVGLCYLLSLGFVEVGEQSRSWNPIPTVRLTLHRGRPPFPLLLQRDNGWAVFPISQITNLMCEVGPDGKLDGSAARLGNCSNSFVNNCDNACENCKVAMRARVSLKCCASAMALRTWLGIGLINAGEQPDHNS